MATSENFELDEEMLLELLDAPTGGQRDFTWVPCSYRLFDGGAELPRRAAPPQVRLRVAVERPPLSLGDPPTWTCYKNCTLPRITVEAESDGPFGARLPERSAVLLSAVTLDAASGAATSCGLDGAVLQPLAHGGCSFSSIYFKTTSYNLKGKHLHVMATLLAPAAEAGGAPAGGTEGGAGPGMVALASFLSPPIRVDARKRQTKERSQLTAATGVGGGGDGAHATALTLTPFAPEMLERRLEKVEKAAEGSGKKQRWPIDNSMEGLRAYLSAVNIRNKCKHPLFLILRFDACVGCVAWSFYMWGG